MKEKPLEMSAIRIIKYLRSDISERSFRGISRGANLPTSTLERQLKNLMTYGYLEKKERAGKSLNGQDVHLYFLTDKGLKRMEEE
jgi:DNA-binding HxlR family transcriptional regulator